MKKLIHTLLFLALCSSVNAQVYSNEWIRFSNRYYKFPVVQTGFYRIDSLALANSGIPLSGINPKNFQLFIKGKEQYVYVKGESDNVFNAADYIEFFAEKNDGRFDSTMYENISYVPNPYVSLLSDTIYAYLTWNSSVSNKRLIIENDTASTSYTPASYFYTEKVYAGNTIYNPVEEYPDDASDPRYTQAEGYGTVISNGQLVNSGFTAINMYNSAALPVTVRMSFSGASISSYVYQDHEMKGVIYDGSNSPVTLFDTIFSGYKAKRYTFNLMSNTLGNGSNIELTSVNNPLFASITNYSMVHYIYYKYPQIPDLGNSAFYELLVNDDAIFSKTFLKLSSVNTGTTNSILFYDLTNHKRIDSKISGAYTKILVPNSGAQKLCYLGAEQNVISVPKVYPVNQTGYFTNYKATMADSAFVIITHSSLMSSAGAYKTYRQSMAGGAHQVVLADIDDLYDQFAYGIKKHPLSVRNFMRFLMDSLPSPPKYLLLIGKSVQNRELRDVPGAWDKCLVPTMGWPPSDNLLTCRLKTNTSIIPEVPLGRISAQSNTEVNWYLSKVQQHESTGPADWKKHVLHFAGGTTDSERSQFQTYLKGYEATIKDTLFGGEVFNFYKTTTAPIQITVSDSVFRHFNYGVSLVTFFGHGSY
ncbi:MAG: putative type IX secretion system sortase PorU2, partial [Bacteroidia bacterium]